MSWWTTNGLTKRQNVRSLLTSGISNFVGPDRKALTIKNAADPLFRGIASKNPHERVAGALTAAIFGGYGLSALGGGGAAAGEAGAGAGEVGAGEVGAGAGAGAGAGEVGTAAGGLDPGVTDLGGFGPNSGSPGASEIGTPSRPGVDYSKFSGNMSRGSQQPQYDYDAQEEADRARQERQRRALMQDYIANGPGSGISTPRLAANPDHWATFQDSPI